MKPLEGVKVADFSWFGAGPICAHHLATYGATVVRVESETHIDSLRTIAPIAKGKTSYNVSGYFNNFNAGKFDLTLNLNTDEGRGVARKLVEWADVFLTNITPRVIERWGLTYDELSRVEPEDHRRLPADAGLRRPAPRLPRLRRGADADHRLQLPQRLPEPPADRPRHELPGLRDQPRPHARRDPRRAALPPPHRQGPAHRVRAARVVASRRSARRSSTTPRTASSRTAPATTSPHAAPHDAFKCKPLTDGGRPMDERWIAIGCFTDARVGGARRGDGQPGVGARREVRDARRLASRTRTSSTPTSTPGRRTKTPTTLMRDLQARGVPAGVVQSAREILDDDEHLKARGYYVYLDHPETGRAAYDGPPFRLSKTPGHLALARPAPRRAHRVRLQGDPRPERRRDRRADGRRRADLDLSYLSADHTCIGPGHIFAKDLSSTARVLPQNARDSLATQPFISARQPSRTAGLLRA